MALRLLNDKRVRNAKPRSAPYRLADGGNLHLFVAASGVKSWQFRYRHDGKQQTATLGRYPDISLAAAREQATLAQKQIAQGIHVTQAQTVAKHKRVAASGQTFEKCAASWVAREARRLKWASQYKQEVEASIRLHLSTLNGIPVSEITAPITAAALRKLDNRPGMHEKVQRRLRAILDHAVEEGLIQGNPMPQTRRGVKTVRRHYPAVTDRAEIGDILRAARAVDPCKGVMRAHVLLAFTAQRIAEVVGATWSEFDLDVGLWRIPRERMKQKDVARGSHEIPLPPELRQRLIEWREADGSDAIKVCPAPRNAESSITPEAIEKFYRDKLGLAGKHSPHSWRAVFKTWCADAGRDSEVVEAQRDHVVGNKVAAAYDRARRLDLRRTLMVWYEGQLLSARDGAKVLTMDERGRASA